MISPPVWVDYTLLVASGVAIGYALAVPTDSPVRVRESRRVRRYRRNVYGDKGRSAGYPR